MIIRLSQRLAQKLHEPRLPAAAPGPNKYLDWYGHLFVHNRVRYVIVINCATIFTTVFWGKGITDLTGFMKMFSDSLSDQCDEIGAGLIYRRTIAPATASFRLAKAPDKHVVGCMNEQISLAKFLLEEEDLSPFHLAKRLNENLLLYIGLHPRQAFIGAKRGPGGIGVIYPEGWGKEEGREQ
jgi:hypothetical protein